MERPGATTVLKSNGQKIAYPVEFPSGTDTKWAKIACIAIP